MKGQKGVAEAEVGGGRNMGVNLFDVAVSVHRCA